jgi:hypothetical protein
MDLVRPRKTHEQVLCLVNTEEQSIHLRFVHVAVHRLRSCKIAKGLGRESTPKHEGYDHVNLDLGKIWGNLMNSGTRIIEKPLYFLLFFLAGAAAASCVLFPFRCLESIIEEHKEEAHSFERWST